MADYITGIKTAEGDKKIDYESLANKPETLKNPEAITFTGAFAGSYDGSNPLEVHIPAGGSGGGEDGKNIASVSVTYNAHTSGTSAPTDTWSTSVPSVAAGQYLWSRLVITYTDGTATTMYSVARSGTNGSNGTNGTTPQREVDYWTPTDKQEIIESVVDEISSELQISVTALNDAIGGGIHE